MYRYTLLASDKAFTDQYQAWKKGSIFSVAMDFEGEFNLHVYGEHLCLIQLFDGSAFFLVDPFKVSKEALEPFFTDGGLEKVMFSCESDAALIRKVYGIQLERVWDVRVQALALGYTGNLSGLMDLYGLEHARENKKKNQMTNWMRRPLDEHQVQYALGDVAQLLALKEILREKVSAQHLSRQVENQMKTCAEAKHPEQPGWTKLPGYRFMSPVEQHYAKYLFIARDDVARRRNVPASRILDKRVLTDLAKKSVRDPQAYANVTKDPEVLASLERQLSEAGKAH